MRYVQFFALSTGYIKGTIPPQFGEKKPIEACGDRSVVILDMRRKIENDIPQIEEMCKQRGYIGYSIREGKSFTDSKEVRPLRLI